MFREVEMKRKNQISFAATTWNVYLYILTSRDPVGVRDVWRELKLSSPSLAQYHINKLLELGMIAQTQEGKYVASEEKRVETLRSFVLLYGKLIPRLIFYGALIAGILAFYIIFWPMAWNFRDLTVIAVAVISIIAFFFEACIQYHSLKKGVQKI
jgi:predicted DNA-binding transcriptional regulator